MIRLRGRGSLLRTLQEHLRAEQAPCCVGVIDAAHHSKVVTGPIVHTPIKVQVLHSARMFYASGLPLWGCGSCKEHF